MKNKFIYIIVLLFSLVLKAGEEPPLSCPPGVDCNGVGGNGYGKAASPIDMYVYVLAIAAFLIIAFVAKKYKTQKI